MTTDFISLRALAASLVCIGASHTSFAAAQDGLVEPADAETEIVVTGEGLPDTPAAQAYDVQVLEREQIIAAPSGRLEDALAPIPGFQQFRRSDSRSANPSAQGATLRALGGNATSRALLLLDGVPQTNPFFGYIPFSALPPERLSQIRVRRGGGSGPFGAGALAGTIELESAGPDDRSPIYGSALINDRGETELAASIAPKLGKGFAVVSGRWDRGQGFFTTPEDQRVPASARAAFDAWSVEARAVAPIAPDTELQARMALFDDDRTLRFGGADSSSSGQDASVRLVGTGDWAFDVLGYVQARNFSNVVVSSTRFVPVLDQRNTPATGIGGKLELRPPVGDDSILRLGADYRRSDGELFETAISAFTGRVRERRNAGGVTSDLGLFAEYDRSFGALTLTGGVRADRYAITDGFFNSRSAGGGFVSQDRFADRSGWEPSFRGAALATLGGGLSVRAAAYTGLRLPTLNELYRPFVVFPVVTQANAALEIERLEGFEAGIDFAPAPKIRLAVTAFDNRVKDAIANVTIDTNLRQRQNIDAIEAQGIELTGSATHGAFSLDAALSYTDATARGSGFAAALDGNRPSQTPRWYAGGSVSWRPAADWLLSLSVRHIGDQFEDDLETTVLPAFTTLGAYIQVPLRKQLALVLRGENLTDAEIVTRNSGGNLDLGAPRTIWGGVRFGF
ncbi:hypothetical protein HME9302_00664 [Alteripontixanthobacter maritimus]|uniref:TonB-dependent receptor n=1 Tax=Alteripontixanthobacter maritimus TaxID=2161824 RepID=A0A369Q406_9SPHN|nr:TonB-dependent receptor [Alteripontixanthobacter maritimus]RDC59474.1 hypothetical protein HME9302_00664 [Alteripontixanthobacter maritimus]